MLITLWVLLSIVALLAVLCVVASEAERERGRKYASGLLAERDAARHEANEYRADAAALQKLLDHETAVREANRKWAEGLQEENTRLRTDLHQLAHKWK